MKNLCALVLALIGIQSVVFAVSYRTSPDEWRGSTTFTDSITAGSGTSSGTAPLTVNGTTVSGILFQNNGTDSAYLGSSASTAYAFYKSDGSTIIGESSQNGSWSFAPNENYTTSSYLPVSVNGGKLQFRYPTAPTYYHNISIDDSSYAGQIPMVFANSYTSDPESRVFSWNNGGDEVSSLYESGKWIWGKKPSVNYGGPTHGIHGSIVVEEPASPTSAESGFFQISSNLGGEYGNRFATTLGGGGLLFDTTVNNGSSSFRLLRNAPGDTGSARTSYTLTHGGDHYWYRSSETIGMTYDASIGRLNVSSEQNTPEIRAVGEQTSSANILIEGVMNSSSGNGSTFVRFVRGSTEIGRIWQNSTTSVAYATSSDMRLKEDLKDFSGLDLVSQLKPYDFKWKDESLGIQRTYGLVAQEAIDVIPSAVGVGDDGEEITKPWSIEYSAIAPINTKAIQELKAEKDAEISALKTALTCVVSAPTSSARQACVSSL